VGENDYEKRDYPFPLQQERIKVRKLFLPKKALYFYRA